MRLLADENLPEQMVERLVAAGHDVARMRDRRPGAPDDDVLAMALAERRLLVTRDLDFGELVVRDASRPPGSSFSAIAGSKLARLPRPSCVSSRYMASG
jgi:predicted nuclease of predicted toxin-antitoxin system